MYRAKSHRATTLLGAGALLAVLALGACGGDAPPSVNADPPAPTTGQLDVGDPIPQPKDKEILTMTGAISNPNQGDQLVFDLKTLDMLPWVELEVNEPFVNKNVTFRGVLMSDLMKASGSSEDSKIRITALDDYKVTFKTSEFATEGTLLATREDGKKMSIAEGGPTRIIFPNGSKVGENTDAWIWNVVSIVVR